MPVTKRTETTVTLPLTTGAVPRAGEIETHADFHDVLVRAFGELYGMPDHIVPRIIRAAEGLYVEATWEEVEPAIESAAQGE